MKFGSETTTYPINDVGSSIADYKHYRVGSLDQAIRTYRISLKVRNSQEEMTEFIRFTTELAQLRKDKKLAYSKDVALQPAFIIQYPKEDIDGSYYVVKCYSVVLDIK